MRNLTYPVHLLFSLYSPHLPVRQTQVIPDGSYPLERFCPPGTSSCHPSPISGKVSQDVSSRSAELMFFLMAAVSLLGPDPPDFGEIVT